MSRRLAVLLSVMVVLIVLGAFEAYWNGFRLNNVGEFVASLRAAMRSPAAPVDLGPANPLRSAGDSEYVVHAFDWPQWQGPERTGVSRETGLLQEWPAAGPRLVWQADYLGAGLSVPTVAAGRIFIMGNRGDTEYVLALNETDGGTVWEPRAVGPVRSNGGGFPGPRSSPTVDGNRVYALGINGDLVCLDVATGEEKWRKDLRADFGGDVGAWGYCESPLVDGDKLICTPGGKSTIVALNKDTGSLIWKCPVPGEDVAHYASMIAADVYGQREYIQFLHGGLAGLDADGHLLWRYAKPANNTANASSPIYHDGAVFAASDYGVGGGLVRLEKNGGEITAREVYFTKNMRNHHGGMVLLDGYIYGSDDFLFTCLEWKTGTRKWSERKAGKGSVAAADGRIYFRNEDGTMLLIEVNPEKYVQHGEFQPPRNSTRPSWPRPVIANGKLYLRDQRYLFCYDVKKQ